MRISPKDFALATSLLALPFFACSSDDSGDSINNAQGPFAIESSSSQAASSSNAQIQSSSDMQILNSSDAQAANSSDATQSSSSAVSLATHKPGDSCGKMETWYGDAEVYQINTQCDDGSETSGFWYSESDSDFGGASRVLWPIELFDYSPYNGLDNIIDYCHGLCGTYELAKGNLDRDPYIKLSFNIGGFSEEKAATIVDASAWEGICIAYSVENDAALELDLGTTGNASVNNDLPSKKLAKSAEGSVLNIPWNEFIQSDSSSNFTGVEASKKIASIKFLVQGADKTNGHFNIMSIGPYNGNCKILK